MGVFKNDVGRPSNKTIMLRRILKISLLILIIGFFGITLYFFSNNKAGKLKGAATNQMFKDKEFDECVREAYAKDNNVSYPTGKLSDKQLKTIKNFSDCAFASDFSGLKKLTGLQKLEISGSGKHPLDLSGNKNLKYLKISVDENLKELNLTGITKLEHLKISVAKNLVKLDLSGNKNLKYLELNNDENLKELNLTGTTKLEHLKLVGVPNIENLDLSKNTNLKYLHIYRSRIESLDLKNNKKLEELILEATNLKFLDLSNNVNLTKLVLNEGNNMLENNPAIDNLDLSNNIKLERVEVIKLKLKKINLSKNPSLKYLDLHYNDLSSIDVSKNRQLTHLNLYSNELSSIDLSKNNKLTYLNLRGSGIRGNGLNFAGGLETIDLSKNVNLKWLSLSDNNLKTFDLSKIKKLEYLNIDRAFGEDAELNEKGILEVLNLKNINSSLKELNSRVYSDSKKIDYLSKIKNLETLELVVAKMQTLDLTNAPKLKKLKITFHDGLKEIIVTDGNDVKYDFNFTLPKPKITVKKLGLKCPSSVKAKEEFECQTNQSGATISVSKTNLAKGYSEKITTKNGNKTRKVKYTAPGYITVKVSKPGYKSVQKKVQILNSNDIVLKCPTTAKVNELFKCTSNLAGVNITASKDGFSGNVLTYTTTAKDKVKDLRYNKAGTITVTASKSGYKTVSKQVKIELDDSLTLKCPTTAKVNEWFKCTSNLAGVKITASSAGFSGNVLSYITSSSDKVKDLRYNKAGTITVTASKSGYKTVNKKVVIK